MTIKTDIPVGAQQPDRWRAPALGVYLVALGIWIATIGVPTDPFQMFVWLWLVTIAWRPSAPWRYHLGFARDWAPAFALLVVYLYSRGLSDEWISMPVHWTMPIRFDEWIGGGELPTARLQDLLCASPCTSNTPPRWYDEVL